MVATRHNAKSRTTRSQPNLTRRVKRHDQITSPDASLTSATSTAIQKPLLLDLFCGAGGAGMGYSHAGFEVVGVDLVAQPHYPFVFRQGDALECLDALLTGREWGGYVLSDFAAIHASPPCQGNSVSRHMVNAVRWKTTPDLVTPIYARLRASGKPWIIENVTGAPMPDNIRLCASMFDLPMIRHRLFASSHLMFAPGSCHHDAYLVEVIGGKIRGIGAYRNSEAFITPGGYTQRREGALRKEDGQRAMGIDWMSIAEMCEAIPPAYTEWLGRQLMAVIEHGKAGAA